MFRRKGPSRLPRDSAVRRADQALRAGDYPTAIAAFTEALQDDPDNIALLLNLSAALHLTGKHSAAIEKLEQVLAADPQNAPALMNLGAAHAALGHLDKAITALVAAVQAAPARRDGHYNLAALYLRKGQIANAMAELELELALHPNHKLARNTLIKLRREHLGR